MKKTTPILAIGIALLVFFLANFSLSSCTKTNTVTVTDTVTVTPTPSKLSLLIGTNWETDSAYSNYTTTGTGTLVYVRGRSGNTVNLDNNFYTWTTNGTQYAVENGTYYQFSWSIVNGDSTLLKMSSSTITDYARILKASSSKITFYDSTAKYLDVLVPAP
ncbi:MAG TPA: hypothetical protein VG605_08195 [Puia sp.]|nr:hypothetical protein [Puia sp.]